MQRDLARQFSFSFGRPERLSQRLAFWMCHSPLYYNLIRPLKFLLLKSGALPWALRLRALQFVLLPLAGRIKDRNLFPVRKVCLKPECPPDDVPMRALVEKGYADLTDVVRLAPEDVKAAVDYFTAANAYDSQVPLNSSFRTFPVKEILAADGKLGDYFSFTPDVSIACPQVASLVKNPLFLRMARQYLGEAPQLYSVNTMLTVPSASKHQVTTMHRDFDDYKQITFFIYWTATSARNGSTYFVPRSHMDPRAKDGGIFLEGAAGSVFALDTFGLHSGNSNVQVPRLTTWIRYGHLPNFTYFADKNYLFAREFGLA